ncbi:MAG: DUF881 domain-containing protein [Clostridia bacterium]|nr:DUF881 domain-containing protein [Clostridia bacterium]
MEDTKKQKNYGQSVLLALLFALLSALVVSQVVARHQSESALTREQQEELQTYQSEVDALEAQIQSQKTEINRLESQYDMALQSLREGNKEFYELYKKYTDDLDAYRVKAGLTTVQGSGVIIRLDDSGLVEGSIIHDTYLVETVNVLREAGAQAISVNGQRVLPTTEILCLGPSIRINGTREFPPYHIYAIGDPEVLTRAYRDSSIYKTIVAQNLIYDVQTSSSVVINAYSGNYKSLITKLFP